MGFFKALWRGAKKTGAWLIEHSEDVARTADAVETFRTGKKPERNDQADRILVLEQRLKLLQEKTDKLEKKLEEKTGKLQVQVQTMDKQIHTLKTWLIATGITLALAVIAIVLLAFVF